jgi:REP element-mobilizing transposase RayT
LKKSGSHTSIYSAVGNLPAALYREIARSAGVHISYEGSDPTYINSRLFGIHMQSNAAPVTVWGMARASRLSGVGGDGGVFHLTHRCHNRAFLLKFARDRDGYRALVREHLECFDVSVLDYCVTSNHVHLLVDAPKRVEVSGFMREVASESARAYNRRKGRSSAVGIGQRARRGRATGHPAN